MKKYNAPCVTIILVKEQESLMLPSSVKGNSVETPGKSAENPGNNSAKQYSDFNDDNDNDPSLPYYSSWDGSSFDNNLGL